MRCLQSIEAADVGLWDWMDVHAPDQCWSNLYYQLLGYEPDDMSSDLVSLDALVHPSFQALTFAPWSARCVKALTWMSSTSC